MKRHLKLKVLVLLSLAYCHPALAAKWEYKAIPDEMDDSLFHTVFLVNKSGYGFGARCSSPANIELVFLAPDASLAGPNSAVTVGVLNENGLKLKVRADKTAPQDFSAALDIVDDRMIRIVVKPASKEAVAMIVGAKTKIALALTFDGSDESIHKTSFDVPAKDTGLSSFLKVCAP